MSNGRYAMLTVARHIRKMPADTSCHQFCIGVTASIRRHYIPFWRCHKTDVMIRLQQHPEERMTASAVVYSRLRREIWLVGDCQCLVGGELYDNPKPYEQVLADRRAEKVRQLLAEGKSADDILTHDIARESVIPQMLQEMHNQNVTYAVIDGFPIPQSKVVTITLDFRPWEIVLASDGYPFLCHTLAESEQRLQQQKRDDPLNIGEFRATKGFTPGYDSFDDRSYIRFNI